jgi:hypothetical protein
VFALFHAMSKQVRYRIDADIYLAIRVILEMNEQLVTPTSPDHQIERATQASGYNGAIVLVFFEDRDLQTSQLGGNSRKHC